MKFGAQISKTRLKMKDAEEVFVCIILSEHTKTQRMKSKVYVYSVFGLNHG